MLGKNWILLRGLTREAAHWGDFVPQLQAAFPKATINCLDLPGTGIYFQETSPATIPEITRQLRHQAQANGWLDGSVTFLGMSLGGMVAWDWLQAYPDDSCGAALINTSLAPLNPFYHRLRWQCYLDLIKIGLQNKVYRRELGILKLVSNCTADYEKTAKAWEQIQIAHPVSWQNTKRQILAAANYRPALQKPVKPVLLLNSLGDRLVSPQCSATIRKRWSLPIACHPWAGHDLCIDDGNWVIKQLLNWLNPVTENRDEAPTTA